MPSIKFLAVASLAVAIAAPASAATRKPSPAASRPDLADMAAGTYAGSVMSDARGSGRPGVTITVTKTGPNTVSVASSYTRLPPFTIKLARYMNTIQQVGTSVVFLLDLSKEPHGLNVTDDDAAFGGTKE